jgi:diketogulonate reductase-like aldo/keto reductase
MAATSVDLRGGGRMPLLGFGTWQLRGGQAYDAVGHALAAGYRHVDTATMYRNEAEVGRALRDSAVPRDEVFVTTKLPPDRVDRARATLDASLRALDTGYVDLWLIHWPPGGHAGVDTWRDLLAARDAGLARAVGVSNYSTAQIDELTTATGEAPAVNQIRWGPALHDPARVAQHRQRGVVLEGYSPFRSTDLGDPVITAVAAAHDVGPAQVVLRWHIEHEVVVIPRSANPERIRANARVFDFSLSADEVARLDGLSAAAAR